MVGRFGFAGGFAPDFFDASRNGRDGDDGEFFEREDDDDDVFEEGAQETEFGGSRERAAGIARALARAFPKDGASPAGCFVGAQ